ncbi:hypothetical protein [Paenibacillus ihuae]|uniref:hypothetical protein n=1 Tax=Paenibacillus ihuae TaxID=1232431 RepID=UPI0006D586D1|nr:hypothetical protein [Paenibacillus ihuae]
MKKKWVLLGTLVLLIVTVLAACDKTVMFVGSNSSSKNKVKASYRLFTGTEEKKVRLKSGETLAINYQSKVEKGELTIKLYDPDNQLIQDMSINESGDEKIGVNKDGIYRFEITGNKTRGSYELKYKIE